MALIRADRIKESSTSTGTGAFTLAGADSTYRTFASVCTVADTVYYAIAHRTANEWEVGLGTYSATNTLTRTTVHSSSNSNAAVTFSAGTKDVLLALTKTQLETYATLAGTETLTNKTINASSNTITNVSLASAVTGTLPLANGGTGTTTAQLAINALAGAVTSGSYLRGNGTNVVMATISAGDVPTLNQNTTGTASGSVSGTASYLAKFTGTNVVGNSLISDNGTNILVGTQNPTYLGRFNITSSVQASTTTGIVLQNFSSLGLIGLDLFNDVNKEAFIGIGGSGYAAPYGNNCVYMAYGTVDLIFGTANTERMRILSGGNVGIGTTSPAGQLHTQASAATTKALVVRGASAQSANLQEWQDSAGTVLSLVDSAGKVAIGTTSTTVKLNVQTASNTIGTGLSYYYTDYGVTSAATTTYANDFLTYGNRGSSNATLWGMRVAHNGSYSGTTVGTSYTRGALLVQCQDYNEGTGSTFGIKIENTYGSASNAYGLYAENAQTPTGNSFAGYFSALAAGTTAYGIYAKSENPAGNRSSTAGEFYISNSVTGNAYGIKVSNAGGITVGTYTGTGTYFGCHVSIAGATVSGAKAAGFFSDGTYTATLCNGSYSALFNGLVGIGTTSPAGQLHTQASAATTKALVVRGASAQSASLQEWQDNAGSTLAAVLSNGAIQPASMADSAAANNTIYYSTTASKLVYKNSAGTVNNLY